MLVLDQLLTFLKDAVPFIPATDRCFIVRLYKCHLSQGFSSEKRMLSALSGIREIRESSLSLSMPIKLFKKTFSYEDLSPNK